tara:strand:- start:1494 stop:1850 length:357 start_codon:yes stop_codon:yes gene_type:complete
MRLGREIAVVTALAMAVVPSLFVAVTVLAVTVSPGRFLAAFSAGLAYDNCVAALERQLPPDGSVRLGEPQFRYRDGQVTAVRLLAELHHADGRISNFFIGCDYATPGSDHTDAIGSAG